MRVNGTLINYYFHCKRQCYLHGNRLNLEDNSEIVQIGKAIIMIDRISDERKVEKEVTGYGSNYLAHAFRRIKEYIKNGNFQEKDVVA